MLVYKQLNTSIISTVAFIDNRTTYSVSSPRACKILNADRRRFQKPVALYEILKVFGSNVVVTEVAPGFSEKVFELVWDTSTWIVLDLFKSEGWDTMAPGEEKEVRNIPEITLKVTLAVLATASFGAPLGPQQDKEATTGHGMSFVEAISLQRIKRADHALRAYMHGMIATRREEIQRGEVSAKHDLLNALVESSVQDTTEEGGAAGGGLSDDELVGNTWIFALAGHETSAHSLAFAIAYLAIHQDKQAWLYEELLDVFPADHTPVYSDYARLPRTLAVIYETLRLHPAVVYIPKYATEDTWLPDEPDNDVGEEEGEGKRVFVPKGTQCGIDTVGLRESALGRRRVEESTLILIIHRSWKDRHPRYWKNPDVFLPERFMEDYDRDAFAPFSAGARGKSCIGRKFSEVENVCVLALLLRHYRILPLSAKGSSDEALDEADDTRVNEVLAERLLATKPGVTLTPKEIGVRLVKRGDGDVRAPML
ncbi:hypothetical protein QFC21_003130 [Naganishia friedmannii]|uniref:Uncharacterized protein n=1 Tax=Naganishia friedmannii TaxID=89922 RepID=A0ACC2VSM6_9TREE|nr:hypothetical protein QFC21_003130 [Naganishia friedmannii]